MPRSKRILAWSLASLTILAAAGAALGEWHQKHDEALDRAHAVTGGDPLAGRGAFTAYGCGGCHQVKGLPGANGHVGPPLDGVGSRTVIAGRLDNSPANLEAWIAHPQAVSPGSDMPELGVTKSDARDIAAFLYSLR